MAAAAARSRGHARPAAAATRPAPPSATAAASASRSRAPARVPLCPGTRPARLHAEAPRREDPPVEVRARGRAQAGDGAVRRREGLDGARRAARPGGVAPHPRPLLPDPRRRRPPLRGHDQPVHGRRHHGAVRRADRARGPRAARLLRRARAPQELRRYANELRRARGLDFAVRIGLHSGEVVVGKIGDDLRMDYTAQGALVGLAARMQQLAEPGKVYVSARRRGWSRATSASRTSARSNVKGVAAPVRVFELAGTGALRTRFDVSRSRGLSRFVGRATRWRALDAALERALAGDAPVVGVVAEAGVGKSRLCFEFLERCRARGHRDDRRAAASRTARRCRCSRPRAAARSFGITEHDAASTAREKIAGRLLLLDESLRDALPLAVRLPRRRRPRAAGACRSTPSARQRALVRPVAPRRPAARPARARGDAGRGSALVRRRERGLPGADGGRAARDARARCS